MVIAFKSGTEEVALPGQLPSLPERGAVSWVLLCFSSISLCILAFTIAMSFLKSFPPPGSSEGLRQQQPDTEAVLNGKGLGTGTLYIAER